MAEMSGKLNAQADLRLRENVAHILGGSQSWSGRNYEEKKLCIA
jgi:hypothetical protein